MAIGEFAEVWLLVYLRPRRKSVESSVPLLLKFPPPRFSLTDNVFCDHHVPMRSLQPSFLDGPPSLPPLWNVRRFKPSRPGELVRDTLCGCSIKLSPIGTTSAQLSSSNRPHDPAPTIHSATVRRLFELSLPSATLAPLFRYFCSTAYFCSATSRRPTLCWTCSLRVREYFAATAQ